MIEVDYNDYKSVVESNMKLIPKNYELTKKVEEQQKEIERLKEEVKEWKHNATRINNDNNKMHSIIKEVRKKLQNELDNYNVTMGRALKIELLEILDKVGEE